MSKDTQRWARGPLGPSIVRALVAAAAVSVAAATGSSAASWASAGAAFVNAANDQSSLRAASDGKGGLIAAWIDLRNTPAEIYCQRVDSTGGAQWTANGVLVCSTFNGIADLAVAPDGANGVLLAWKADRGAGSTNVFVQHVNASGLPQWTVNGLRVETSTVTSQQGSPAICSDGSGGGVVAWVDGRGSSDDIYLQHVASDSSRTWGAGGLPVLLDAGAEQAPRMLPDGAGGAFVSWEDAAPGAKTNFQHFDGAGAAVYPASFSPAGSLSALMVRQALSDTLVVVWASTTPDKIFGAKLDPSGVPVTDPPVALQPTSALPVGLVSQSSGGALVVHASGSAIGALTMNALGIAGTGSATIASGQSLDASSNITAVGDGGDGLYCVWSSLGRVYARHLTAAAANDWNAAVRLAPGVTSTQTSPVAVGGTDLLAGWIDDRNVGTTGDDLFAQRVSYSGLTGSYHRIVITLGSGTGTITPGVGRIYVTEGDSLRVVCTGTGGAHLDHLVVGATSLVAVPNYTFHLVTGDSALAAHFSSAPITTQVAAVAGSYRAFSVPSTFANSAPSAVFANLMPYDVTRWRLGHWVADDSIYVDPSGALAHIVPGEGYWFVGLKDTTLSFSGTPVAQSMFILPMLGRTVTGHGWTQFGSPFRFPLAVTQLRLSLGADEPITNVSNTLTDHQVYEWNPGSSSYVTSAVLLPGHAYWLWRQSVADVSLRFPYEWNPVALVTPTPALRPGAQWAVQVAAHSGAREARLTFGAAEVPAGKWNGLSSRALPSVPGDGLSLVARVADWGDADGEYQSVFRPDGETLAWDFDASASSGLTETSLAFTFTNLPPGRRVVLSEPAAGWSRELTPAAELSLVLTSTPRRLRLEVLAGGPVTPRPPATTALRALGPNPFRDATTLAFTLAHAGPLRWDVFDLSGRRVTSELRPLAAGEHAIPWDGRDGSGRRVTPGLYLLRWQADGRSGTVRLVRVE